MTAASATPVLVETAGTGGRTMPISTVVCRPERVVTVEELTAQMPAADVRDVISVAGRRAPRSMTSTPTQPAATRSRPHA